MSRDSGFAELSTRAWAVRRHARVLGQTKVGCAVRSSGGRVFEGCNVEHRFRSHDIHAEVNALSSLVAAGDAKVEVVFIAADRDQFTPCGACLDWIFEIGGPEVVVAFQSDPDNEPVVWSAKDLMPHYPR